MSFLFYFKYNLLLLIVLPFVWLAALFNDKLGGSLSGQKNIQKALNSFNNKVKGNPKPIVWLHAASAGEYEQIRPLLSRLKLLDVYVFQTFTSATIFYKVSHAGEFDGVSFLPWDLYPRLNKFISALKPDIFINTRHDIWPNLLRALNNNKVHNILINANLYEDSLRLKPALRSINRMLFNRIDRVYTGSEKLEALLGQVYDGEINIVGDSRFDQVNERAQANSKDLLSKDLIGDRRVVVYGSVMPSDMQVVCSAIIKASQEADILHVVVPHEVKERDLTPWEVELYRQQMKTVRISELSEYNNESVIIWNSVGELADLYKHATLAYIGAGFTTGVHSVTEAAIYHTPSAHGPVYSILAEAIELVELKLSTVVNTDEELYNFLLLDDNRIAELSRQIETFTKERIGATDRIIAREFPLNK